MLLPHDVLEDAGEAGGELAVQDAEHGCGTDTPQQHRPALVCPNVEDYIRLVLNTILLILELRINQNQYY